MEILKNPNFDFIGKTRYFVALSLAIIVAGIAHMYVRGIHYGVEFSGGTQLIVKFEKQPQTDRIRAAVGHSPSITTHSSPLRTARVARLASAPKAARTPISGNSGSLVDMRRRRPR